MPIAIVILLFDLTLLIHAAKTGRLCRWGFIIMAIPVFGALAYIGLEVIPEWLGSIEGQKAQAAFRRTIDPNKRVRELYDQLARADTVANRVQVANECLALGRHAEALEHFDAVLHRPMGQEPAYVLGKAKAQFGMSHFDSTVATLDDLRARWPEFQSPEGHLIYARALEAAGRSAEALTEYEIVSEYFPGAEARVRFGLLLLAAGQIEKARAILGGVLERAAAMPKYLRKVEADWIATAEKALKH